MSTALMTFLRNYHWKGYNVETIQSTPNMLTNLHRGKYPIHRLCHNVNIECRAFNLMEVCTWLNGEKWNILWAEDESWLPEETTVVMGATLPHGFHKVIPRECDEVYLQALVEYHRIRWFLSLRSRGATQRICMLGQLQTLCNSCKECPTMCYYCRNYACLQYLR